MIIEPGQPEDLPVILTMREEASRWLGARGIDQWREPWPTEEAMGERIAASIRAGETWMVRDHAGATAATVALDTFADPRLWTPEERQESALFSSALLIPQRRKAEPDSRSRKCPCCPRCP